MHNKINKTFVYYLKQLWEDGERTWVRGILGYRESWGTENSEVRGIVGNRESLGTGNRGTAPNLFIKIICDSCKQLSSVLFSRLAHFCVAIVAIQQLLGFFFLENEPFENSS